jgi:hypothetical protein
VTLRFIVARTEQTGPDDFERQFRTLDADVPALEALLRIGWSFQGVERDPGAERAKERT